MKHQNRVTSLRNNVSHEASNLAKGIDLIPEFSEILSTKGNPILKIKAHLPNYKQEFNGIKSAYMKAHDGINVVFNFLIEGFNLPYF